MQTFNPCVCGFVNSHTAELCARCGIELINRTAPPSISTYAPTPSYGNAVNQQFEIKPFDSAGQAIGSGLRLFCGNLWMLVKVVLVIYAPYEVFRHLTLSSVGSEWSGWQEFLGVILLWASCSVLAGPAVILSLMAVIQGTPVPGVSEVYRAVLSRLPAVIPAALAAWVLVVVGYLFLIIPGIILTLAFYLVYPVATLENGRSLQTLKRCWDLTDGYKWRILLAAIGMALLQWLVTLVLGFVLSLFMSGGWFLVALTSMAIDVLSMLGVVLSLVIYLGLLKRTQVYDGPIS